MFAFAERYGRIAQFFHWGTFTLVFVSFIVSIGGSEERVYSAANSFYLSLHELFGITVFAVTVLRLLWRVFNPPPPSPNMPWWMERSSKLVQWALYVLLLMVPLTAIIGAWLEDHPVTLLGFGSIAPMVQGPRPIGEILSDLHGLIGDSLIWLAGVHGAAALFHHFWLRDNVLWSMFPWVSRH